MFLKPFKLKSNAPLKGSDSKRLRLRIQQAFPDITAEQIQQLIPNKSAVTMLKVTISDFQTSVYCVDKRPMFFEAEGGVLVPTLYTMWIVPDLLPYFTTHAGVLPKLSNGADLMLPGVIPLGVGMNMYGRFKKGQLVAINLTTNKSAVGVGVLTRSSDDLYMCGGHGSAVKMLHIFGDKLWGHEPSLVMQIPDKAPAKLTEDDFPALGASPENKANPIIEKILDPTANKEDEVHEEGEHPTEQEPEEGNDLTENLESLEIQAAPEPDAAAVADRILRNAFLTALKHHSKDITLPLLTSNFYRLHVVPEAKSQIDLKKTKYKKLSNFLNEMIDEGFIVVREETKGVDKIISIDYDHPELVNFIADAKSPADDKENGQQPLYHSEMTELYLVTEQVIAFFTKMNYKQGEGISSVQIKKILREYVSKNNLPIADPVKKSIKLDDCLQLICGRPEAPFETVYNIILNKMKHTYEMRSTKDVPKNKPLIQMTLATRSGNKKVTLVSNIECYGIILPEFIKLCKQGAAASTTIVKVPNQNREMLQIQGNQVRFVFNLLTETYKIPPKKIQGLELAKPIKKKK